MPAIYFWGGEFWLVSFIPAGVLTGIMLAEPQLGQTSCRVEIRQIE